MLGALIRDWTQQLSRRADDHFVLSPQQFQTEIARERVRASRRSIAFCLITVYKLPNMVVFLTHCIPLYQVRVLQSIAASVRDFPLLVGTPIGPNRECEPVWSGLDVAVQRTWAFRQNGKHRKLDHAGDFRDSSYGHVPQDTVRRLKASRPDVVMSLELGSRSLGAMTYCRRHPETKSVLCTYMRERIEKRGNRT